MPSILLYKNLKNFGKFTGKHLQYTSVGQYTYLGIFLGYISIKQGNIFKRDA